MELELVEVTKPAEVNLILGQTHFIKTVEDLYEILVGASPGSGSASPSARPRGPA